MKTIAEVLDAFEIAALKEGLSRNTRKTYGPSDLAGMNTTHENSNAPLCAWLPPRRNGGQDGLTTGARPFESMTLEQYAMENRKLRGMIDRVKRQLTLTLERVVTLSQPPEAGMPVEQPEAMEGPR